MQTYTRNIEIKDLPMSSNNILNTLARLRGVTKIVIVREALVEYAKNHLQDIFNITGEVVKISDEEEETEDA
jgi:hypothetical protein